MSMFWLLPNTTTSKSTAADMDLEKDHTPHGCLHVEDYSYDSYKLMSSWKEIAGVLFLLVVHLALGFMTDFSNHSRTQLILNAME
mmetsp:Transcript_22927/g.56499  ORF Transcript_22927/g.56499 Transcript_22927/m.56499 type:complete len:85 (-) Transcript_22927:566-820(-)|eukprot:CAMPEP_0113640266 /NCGR_PEP_ID=MMETSP0017_2-20120614/21130_1 /TAXON_ID=2856 /ORGANISM="Cylindrotheca closterium" /LENGTH=84 /DNA_ID=CAMNT_0000551533 /DNA_START=21 /DNA_END=275 /DNA_ORIENTATION=- /assembly_acc=CAM_ASM_000147